MTIIEFIEARITEDEAEIGAEIYGHDDSAGPNGIGWAEVGAISEVLLCSHRRARAQCEAMRRIVAEYLDMLPVENERHEQVATLRYVLREFTAIWSDHPDYQSEWAPS